MKLLTIEDALPCPFCGNETALILLDSNEWFDLKPGDMGYCDDPDYVVGCCVVPGYAVPHGWTPGCGGSSGYYPTPERALASWNRRTE